MTIPKNILTVGEHETIYVSDYGRDIAKKQISVGDMRTLLGIDFNLKSYDKQVFKQDGRNIKTQSFVGSIQIDQDLIIEILPKFIKTNQDLDEKSIQQYRETLMNMIILSAKSKSLSSQNVALKNQNGELPMFETLIFFFAEALSEELRKGLHREYTKMTDNLNQMKGRLVIQEHLRRNMFDLAKLYVEFESYSIDNNLMRIFKASIRLLMEQHQISPITKQKLSEALYLLNDVSDFSIALKDFDTVTFHRMNSRFEELFTQCRFLIMKFYPFSITADSKTRFWSILFDMDELFENFLAFLLARSDISFEDQFSFHAYRAPYGSKNVGGRPDFVFFKENSIISVADAKWKLYDPSRSSSSNMGGLDWANFWQLTSYMYLLSREPIPGYFIVPAKSKDVPREVHYQSPRDYHADIFVLTIDFTIPINDILETHRFSIDEKNRLRLSAYLTAKQWIDRLIDEFNKIRNAGESLVAEDENFYPCMCLLGEKTGYKITSLAVLLISATHKVYSDTMENMVKKYSSSLSMDKLPYIELISFLVESLAPHIEPEIKQNSPEATKIKKQKPQALDINDETITWDIFDITINNFYSEFDSILDYSPSMYTSNLDKIRNGVMNKPVKDVKYFSLDRNKLIVFLFSEDEVVIRIENPDQTGLTRVIRKTKFFKMIGGLYSATLKSVSSIESTLPYLKHYLSFILLDKQSPSSPNPKSTNISSHIPKEDLIPPVLSFKESVNFLSETLFNKNHHIYPMEHDIEWRSKNPEPLETTSRISIIVDNIIYASALRISDCVSIELYDIDPEAFSYSLFVKFPSSLDVPIS